MKKIIICGYGDNAIKLMYKFKKIGYKILGNIMPSNLSVEKMIAQKELLDKIEVPLMKLEDLADMANLNLFSINFNQIMEESIVESNNIINLHMGILPKWRGNSANTWAIINDEKYVGYTLHKMEAGLDSGDIYYTKKFRIGEKQTYSDVYSRITHSIINDVPNIVNKIIDGDIMPIKQHGNYVYCTLFKPEIGIFEEFNKTSNYIFNVYRCMARPHGTGIHFIYNNKLYEVNKVLRGSDYQIENYIERPGKIVYIKDDEIFIKTIDNVIIFKGIHEENNLNVDIDMSIFKIGRMCGKI